MALDIAMIMVSAIALFLLGVIFIVLLRRSNKLMVRNLYLMNEQLKNLEKLVGKFIDMTVENRKEIVNLKKESNEEAKIPNLKKDFQPEIQAEEPVAALATEKTPTRTGKTR